MKAPFAAEPKSVIEMITPVASTSTAPMTPLTPYDRVGKASLGSSPEEDKYGGDSAAITGKLRQRPFRNRHRLRREMRAKLEEEYLMEPRWSTRRITDIAKRLNLNRTKVYKWHWERKNKD
eukprot:CAMPEP_0170457674 /NCGR_PEP_ID=MMETSP0123-20130129/4885_1 /TAXON_ID=182087 /ORGANISM="Favella ehrenbergii, Strain Fehren 1" /LENGTH=120 /DNA_ID=CAMNT_0010721541 /DNA_START=538 /DNA_END=899 /DNA_ORIENTATION=-